MNRGRYAETPRAIPAKGWKDIAFRVKDEMASDHVGLIAAGVAFYALLAIFPAITALMALAGLAMEPAEVTLQLKTFTAMIPKEAAQIILDQAVAVTGSEETGLGLAFVLGLLLAIYSSSKGMGSLIEGLNVAYDESEQRGFIKKMFTTLTLTLFLIVGLLMGLAASLAVPAVLGFVTLPSWLETTVALSGWVIWIIASLGFSIYVSNFGSYNESFGSMAGVIILLMWLWISAFIVLLGAELNSEIEAQTRYDTTVGPGEPMGERGAVKADTLGRSAEAD